MIFKVIWKKKFNLYCVNMCRFLVGERRRKKELRLVQLLKWSVSHKTHTTNLDAFLPWILPNLGNHYSLSIIILIPICWSSLPLFACSENKTKFIKELKSGFTIFLYASFLEAQSLKNILLLLFFDCLPSYLTSGYPLF